MFESENIFCINVWKKKQQNLLDKIEVHNRIRMLGIANVKPNSIGWT